MIRVEEEIHIDRPVADVFAFATDPDNQLLLNTNMVDYELEGPMEKGARPRGRTRVAGKRIDWETEILEFEQDRRVELRSIDAPVEFHITWHYEPDGEGTRIRFEQESPSLGGFFGRMSDTVVVKMYGRDVRSNLEKLKVLLENDEG
jgi:uncharacterized membrane protein